jgi:predicted RNA-binding Zn-ribbon protein involved in translation (DUF1610 family)
MKGPNKAGQPTCPKCGHKLPINFASRYCPSCGHDMPYIEAYQREAGQPSPWSSLVNVDPAEEMAERLAEGQPSDDAVERLGEALFVLSDRLRASGVLSASDPVHQAYEGVVAAFQPLAAMQSTDTEAVIELLREGALDMGTQERLRSKDRAEAALAKLKERGHG